MLLKKLSRAGLCLVPALALAMLAGQPVPVAAQSTPAPAAENAPANVEEIREAINSFTLPATLLANLEAPAKKMASEIARINGLLKGNIDKIENAEKEFDRLIALVDEAAKTGDEQGGFVTSLDQLIKQSRQEALDARNDGDEANAKAFEDFAKKFVAGKEQAIKFKGDSFRIKRQIEKQKRFFVRSFKLKQFEQAAENMRVGLALMTSFQEQLQGVRKALPETAGETQ